MSEMSELASVASLSSSQGHLGTPYVSQSELPIATVSRAACSGSQPAVQPRFSCFISQPLTARRGLSLLASIRALAMFATCRLTQR